MDMFDKKTRSRIMRSVRVARTEPEESGCGPTRSARFRRNGRRRKPDFVFRGDRCLRDEHGRCVRVYVVSNENENSA